MRRKPPKKPTKPAKKSSTGTHSLRELARALGINHNAVNDGVRSGRLGASLTYLPGGKPAIRDLQLAMDEWHANRQPQANDDGDESGPVERPDGIPTYTDSRAKREYHLAEIAEAEARKVTGGRWVPVSQLEALEATYERTTQHVIRHMRLELPGALLRRCDVQRIASSIAAINNGSGKCVAASAVKDIAFRLLLHEARLAVDDVLAGLAEIAPAPAKEPTS